MTQENANQIILDLITGKAGIEDVARRYLAVSTSRDGAIDALGTIIADVQAVVDYVLRG